MSARVAIIGSGSWATALAKLFLNNCRSIGWFIRKDEDVAYFREFKNNPRYLSSVEFDTDQIHFYTDLEKCIAEAEYLVLAIPSAFLNDTFIAGIGEVIYRPYHNIIMTTTCRLNL